MPEHICGKASVIGGMRSLVAQAGLHGFLGSIHFPVVVPFMGVSTNEGTQNRGCMRGNQIPLKWMMKWGTPISGNAQMIASE